MMWESAKFGKKPQWILGLNEVLLKSIEMCSLIQYVNNMSNPIEVILYIVYILNATNNTL
jgi:hypothetical protein